jgi:hypothetical protein
VEPRTILGQVFLTAVGGIASYAAIHFGLPIFGFDGLDDLVASFSGTPVDQLIPQPT